MRISSLIWSFNLGILFNLFTCQVITAQVTSDNTVNTQVTQNGDTAEITGGETRGGNLFHSFQDFSVPTDNTAFFDNADAIENIFSRVTGGNMSNIDGLIKANGSASLFLINPAGIIFGENARLDIGGSFYGSTASSVLFEDGEFSAVDNIEQPVLTINAPIGLGFRDNPGDIVNRSIVQNSDEEVIGLEVNPGNNLTFLGGNISFDGGIITAPGGIVELGGLSTAGEMGINQDGSLSFPEGIERADVSLANNAEVNVIDEIGGSININARNLELIENSSLISGTQEGEQTVEAQAGNININTTNDVSIVESRLENEVKENATNNSGNIEITAQNISLSEDTLLSTQTLGNGNGGDITITALDLVSLNKSEIETEVESVSSGTGTGGSISINTTDLNLNNDAVIQAGTESEKNAGDVRVNASNSVFLNDSRIENQVDVDSLGNAGIISSNATDAIFLNNSFINSRVNAGAVGNSGGIELTTGNLSIVNNAGLTATTEGQGDSGLISIETTEGIVLEDGSFINSRVDENGTGNSNGIEIDTNTLSLINEASINSPTEGQGNAGIISINATDTIFLNNSFINSRVNAEAVGNSGGIELTTGNLSIMNNAALTATTEGQGDSGLISIETTEGIVLEDSSFINSRVDENGTGDSNGIEITSGSLEITGDSRILSTTQGRGDAGNVTINVEDQFVLDKSNIQTQVLGDGGVGNAGDIEITSGSLEISGESLILATSQGIGNAGNVKINVQDEVLLSEDSRILTQVLENGGQGNGGNVEINTDFLELASRAAIFVDMRGQGNAGDIIIEADEIRLTERNTIGNGIFEDAQGNSGNVDIKTDILSIENFSRITTSARNTAVGNPGDIFINADTIRVSRGGIITSFTANNFDGGEITINSQTLDITNGGNIYTGTQNIGNAGDINLNVSEMILIDGNNPTFRPPEINPFRAEVLNSLEGRTGILADAVNNSTGSGGNINIDTNFIIAFPNGNSDIVANASSGNGGNITINARGVFGIEERRRLNSSTNDINASSDFSLDGSVNINTPDVNPVQGATELSTNVVEPGQTTEQACQANREALAEGGLNITGKGGIVPEPGLPLNSLNVSVAGESTSASNIPAPIETAKGKVQPARGIRVTESGDIILTAYRTNNAGERIPEGERNCGKV